MKVNKFICRKCTFEWDGLGDDGLCPFCNSADITDLCQLVKRRCSECAYVWSEIGRSGACPACGSSVVADYIPPRKLRCNACSHGWVSRQDYPQCPKCKAYDIGFDWDVDARYDIILDEPGERRAQVVMTVADLCTVTIPSASAMVDDCPVNLMEDIDEMTAVQLKIRFEDMGATFTMKVCEKDSSAEAAC